MHASKYAAPWQLSATRHSRLSGKGLRLYAENMSSDTVLALIAAGSGLTGVLVGEMFSSRRWRVEMNVSRHRLEAEALENRRQESRVEIGDRRVATRDDYSAILSFLDRLDRCITQSILTMNEGAQERLVTSRVVEMTNTVVIQLTQLGENATPRSLWNAGRLTRSGPRWFRYRTRCWNCGWRCHWLLRSRISSLATSWQAVRGAEPTGSEGR